jgi:mannose/fructose/N-acetylgalactosamine-specific phosphotransferase system component IID
MTAIQIVITVMLVLLIAAAMWMAYAFGYEKGINDLTKEIDEGIRKLKDEQE